MFPFKKYEPSRARRGKRCNLIKIQGSFNPGGKKRQGDETIGLYPHQIYPQRIQIYLSFLAPHTCCLRGLPPPPPRTMQVKNDDSKSPIGVDMTMKGEKGWSLIGI